MIKQIYCCECDSHVDARLTDGLEIYNRDKYSHLDFYICDNCFNYVGCHKGTLKPLGTIPTPMVRKLRQKLHEKLDELWKSGKMKRSAVYRRMSQILNKEFHCGEVNSSNEYCEVCNAIDLIKGEL